jgi:outer membrane protein insertion porin family
MNPPPRLTAVFLSSLLLFAFGCKEDAGSVKVAKLVFSGNQAFNDGALRAVIVTEAKGILPWARSRYFNRQVFDADLQRLRAFYTDRGYPSATVDGVDVSFNQPRDQVTIRIVVNEGPPLLIERVDTIGLEGLPNGVADAVRAVLVHAGRPFDRASVASSREQAAFALKDRGYPDAKVELSEKDGSTPSSRVLTFTATPGDLSQFGAVTTVGLKAVDAAVVRRTMAFHTGDTYRESQVLESQRRLAALGVFQFAHVVRTVDAPSSVTPSTAPMPTGPAKSAVPGAVPISVTVTEARPTRLRLGVGYGSEDGPRGSLNWQHVNFLGSARRLSTDAKYSLRLRGIGIDLVQPYVFSRWLSLRGHAGASWTREPNYSSRRVGGRGSLEYRRRGSRGLDREPREHIVRVTYANEALHYAITPQTLEDLTQFDQLVALGFDPVTGSGSGRLAAFGVDLERNQVDRAIDPGAGYTLALHAERAARGLGGTYDFTEVTTDTRAYLPVGGAVIAGKVRVGMLLAQEARDVPFSARYFLGGSSSLRGWGRFQVAPLTEDGLPIGGRGMFESSIEARVPLTGRFGLVLFTDAGNVWTDRSQISVSDLRSDVGAGVRWTSPIGVVRADLGYQLTTIPDLIVNGQPERRRWRVHFSIGEAF